MPAPLPPIEELIPHGAPMILIDRLTALEPGYGSGETWLRPGALDDSGQGVGAAWSLEIVSQVCAALIGHHYRDRGYEQGRLIQSKRWTLNRPRLPIRQRLLAEVTLTAASDLGVFLFAGKLSGNNAILATGELTILAQ